MTEVEWTPKAFDLLERFDTEAQERLVKKLNEAKDWTSHRLEKLSDYPYYKLRTGDYRAIIAWNRDEDVLIVEVVGHRRNIYSITARVPRGFNPRANSVRFIIHSIVLDRTVG